jgi:phosphoribosylanthranilate isomerase
MIGVKVCGLTDIQNAREIAASGADFAGFIFYPQSKRYVGDAPDPELFRAVPPTVRKVGVFVDAEMETVVRKALLYDLYAVQLHGSELPAACERIRSAGIRVIKAFGVGESFDFGQLKSYAGSCDYFLFDTAGTQHGGSGLPFSWELLQRYTLEVPFFLAGGIGPSDAAALQALVHPQLKVVDINSRFEIRPGLKEVNQVRKFIQEIKNKS